MDNYISSDHRTIVDILRWRARRQADKTAYNFLASDSESPLKLTYGELDNGARAVAGHLQRMGMSSERALLLYSNASDFIIPFLGCLYAGATGVPVNVPNLNRHASRVMSIAEDANAKMALSTQAIYSQIKHRSISVPLLKQSSWFITDQIISKEEYGHYGDIANNLAYLQYTSGSTSDPKGIMVSQKNLLHNLAIQKSLYDHEADSVLVSWVPHFHDMGLIYGLLQPLYTGFLGVLMPPALFIQRPSLWLEVLTQYKATHTVAPNFAYDLCVQKIPEERRSMYDLRSLRVAINGSEPVRAETIDRFAEAFHVCGFNKGAFSPAYGLAEATLAVTATKLGERVEFVKVDSEWLAHNRIVEAVGDELAHVSVGCGRPQLNTKVIIVNPETRLKCRANDVGEVWVAGESVALGYWRKPERTQEVFQAFLTDTGEGPFLRTGDLGFIHNDNLFITGRLKDLIVIRGMNYYPQDIERLVEFGNSAIKPSCGAAFSVDLAGEERLVIVYEAARIHRKTDLSDVVSNIRRVVSEGANLQAHAIAIIAPGAIPKTSSGKIQRHACRELFLNNQLNVLHSWQRNVGDANSGAETRGFTVAAKPEKKAHELRKWMIDKIAEQCGEPGEEIDIYQPFTYYGLDSKLAAGVTADLESYLNRKLDPAILYKYPCVESLTQHLFETEIRLSEVVAVDDSPSARREPIAVIGMSCRFPGARNIDEFWRLVVNGVDAITEIPRSRYDVERFYDPDASVKGKASTRWGGFIDDIDLFDANFFGITPTEAIRMDPQQRLLLEKAWEALEDAGQVREKLLGTKTGVFIGISTNDYGRPLLGDVESINKYVSTGNALSVAANRISYFFDWRGPSMAVDTACSSSLVAVHLACQSLWNQESSLALAGGVNLILSPALAVEFSKSGLMAPDGRCKPFDHRGDGYVRSEGVGAVILKPITKALADKDNIYCLILGSAINQDGRSNGILAPNQKSQESVLKEAYDRARIDPAKVQYIEAHGTGTLLGDSIEISALNAVLGEKRRPDNHCYLGSVKSNIGHTESAAGIAGFIKTALSLRHKLMPASIHYEKPNPHISYDQICLRVVERAKAWEGEGRRIAGVSSFGFGGSNSHIVLGEAPLMDKYGGSEEQGNSTPCVLPLSARSVDALVMLAQTYLEFFKENEFLNIKDLCRAASTQRSHHTHRLALVGDSVQTFRNQFEAYLLNNIITGVATGRSTSTPLRRVFVFSGHGSQWTGMGRELMSNSDVFRASIERCEAQIKRHASWSLSETLLDEEDIVNLSVDILQPTLFAIQVSLANVWRAWGVEPDAVVGHSMGEVAAAHIAGVLSLEDAVQIICLRSKLAKQVNLRNGMAAIGLAEGAVKLVLEKYNDKVSIAACNSPKSTVISGDLEMVNEIISHLESRDIFSRRINVDYASHCRAVDPLKDTLIGGLNNIRPSPARIPVCSTVTGSFLDARNYTAEYWWKNLREPVQFSGAISELITSEYDTFIEISPNPILNLPITECIQHLDARGVIVSSGRRGMNERAILLSSLASLYTSGQDISWDKVYPDKTVFVPLPNYQFDRKRFWAPQLDDESYETSILRTGVDMLKDNGNQQTGAIGGAAMPYETKNGKKENLAKLTKLVGKMMQLDQADLDVHRPLIELGADSLTLVGVVDAIKKEFDVEISIRQLFETHQTIHLIADHINQSMPPARQIESAIKSQEHSDAGLSESAGNGKNREQDVPLRTDYAKEITFNDAGFKADRLMSEQLSVLSHILSKQLDVLRERRFGLGDESDFSKKQPGEIDSGWKADHEPEDMVSARLTSNKSAPQPAEQKWQDSVESSQNKYTPYSPIKPEDKISLSQQQQDTLNRLIGNINAKTQKSKRLTQENRRYLSDNRASAGFKFSVKEMLYPIQCERSSGSKIWDLDGNEYIDLTMGFGVNLFGHNPQFVVESIRGQLDKGIQLGPQSHLAGDVARLISEVTNMERVTFCNSGTEAVMTALRIARAANGRRKIALFSGSYHGAFDGVLSRAVISGGENQSAPLAPGVIPGFVEDLIVLDYADPKSLETIVKHSAELSAVLVEPVQSRRPDLQPKEYLHELRRITSQFGIALIFDEIITGFRIAPGGAQEWFGVKADIAAYGKIIGGGLPIGVVAGSAAYLDTIDGGYWEYGDLSYPRSKTTFFAGTFCKHPLAMAASKAVLMEIKKQGAGLQNGLNKKTERLALILNEYFDAERAPLHIVYFGSLFRFSFKGNMDLLFYHLLDKGIYIWEGRNCFLSASHSDADVEAIIRAVKNSVSELKGGGGGTPTVPKSKPSVNESSNGSHDPEPHTIVRSSTDTIPLTETQKQLWTLAEIDQQASTTYNITVAIEMTGAIDAQNLRKAYQEVVDRHESLRTVINESGETQTILPRHQANFAVDDISHINEQGSDGRIQQWLRAESGRKFDLAREPLSRMRLLKIGNDRHILALSAHHIVADGYSVGIVFSEFDQIYTALCQGYAPKLGKPFQYREYIEQLNQDEHAIKTANDETFWLNQFKGRMPVLNMPTDHPRPPVKTYRGERRSAVIEGELALKIKRYCRQEGYTPFTALFTAFLILIHRYSNQDDLVVGVPILGRSTDQSKNVVGYCAQILAIRANISGDMTIPVMLKAVSSLLLDSFEHDHYPFPYLVKKLNPVRSSERSPIFDIFFNLDRKDDSANLNGIKMRPITVPISNSKFDLGLDVVETNNRYLVEIEYNTDLFSETTANRILGHWQVVLHSIVSRFDKRIAEVPLLSEEECERTLVKWNETEREYPRDKSVHRLFEEQVERSPDAVAVVFGDEMLSYGELNRRANQLARYLKGCGVGPEVLVGVCLERSVEMIIGLLGALKAGGAYLPLDAEYPAERLTYMLEDSGVSVLLTKTHLQRRLPRHRAQVIRLDSWRQFRGENENTIESLSCPENLAYVMYTSGSTGRPKGVCITHGGLSNYLSWAMNEYRMAESGGAHLHSSLSFDLTVTSLFLPLLAGRKVTVVAETDDICPIRTEIRELSNYNLVKLTPSHLELLNQEQWPAMGRISALIIGGEPLRYDQIEKWRQEGIGTRLINEYGPTETVVGCCAYEVGAEDPRSGSTPIGKPIRNTQVYVLEEEKHPAAIGMRGELYIGGAGVGRGYLNRADLTAERFIPNPVGRLRGDRLYRTGDLARWREDGNLEFLGRLDDQVKVRGFRIEPGEIEVALLREESVKEAVVAMREDEPGEKRLVAYVVADGEGKVSASLLRERLQESLPAYMAPAAFVLMDALPLTPNGKLDRRALPPPDGHRPEAEGGYEAPRTALEGKLAEIWGQLLHQERVGIHDNFFELGGDSILGLQVVSRAAQAGLRMTAKQLFRHQTIAALCAVAEPVGAKPAGPEPVWGDIPLTPIQHWFFERRLQSPAHFNQSATLKLSRPLNRRRWRETAALLVRRHDALRLSFSRSGHGWVQMVEPEVDEAPFRWVECRGLGEEEVRRKLEEVGGELQADFDLGKPPLMRVAYLDCGEQGGRLLLVAHHLIVDGVSWRILLEEAARAYGRGGEEYEWPAGAISFSQWAVSLASEVCAGVVDGSRAYWLAEERREAPRLPLDLEDGANDAGSAETLTMRLSKEQTEALLREAPRAYHTQINDVLLTALLESWREWSGERRLLLDLEGHGRESLLPGLDCDLSRTVGWFTSIYPVMLELPASVDAGDKLKAIKEQLRKTPDRGMSYGLLRYLRGDGELKRRLEDLPRAEVAFNYLGQFEGTSEGEEFGELSWESAGEEQSRDGERAHVLEINGHVSEGRLSMSWTWSVNRHRRETIERLAEGFQRALLEMISHCRSRKSSSFTFSDFAAAQLSQLELDRLFDDLNENDKLVPNDLSDICGLSPTQEGMLFESLLAPDIGRYVVQVCFSMRPSIDIGVFRKCWAYVIERHSILRTSFYWDKIAVPAQLIWRQLEAPFECLDWLGLSSGAQQEQWNSLLLADRKRGFDLASPPLMRWTLVRTSEDACRFLWSFHHILLDGWSTFSILKEVFSFYEAFSQGRELQLPRSRNYKDYISWLQEKDLAGAERFWREKLSGFTEPTQLRVSWGRKEQAGGGVEAEAGHSVVSIRLSEERAAEVRGFARRRQLTLNTLAQGAWAILLSRYSGVEDVLFGATVSGRSEGLAGIEEMAGLFINTLPVRVGVRPDHGVVKWLKQLQEYNVEMMRFEYSPLVQVQGWSDVPRGQQLFETILVFENYPIHNSFIDHKGQILIDEFESYDNTNYALLFLVDAYKDVVLNLSYDRNHFSADVIQRMLEHLRILLEGMAADPEGRLGDLPIMSEAEREQVLVKWNETEREYPRDKSVHQLFEEQVERSPDAVAVVFGDEMLSYGELNGRANQLAHYLCGSAVGPEVRVALCLGRKLETVVGILGILKAGGAYLPIDPEQPAARVASLLDDADAPVALTEEAVRDRLQEHWAQVVSLDGDWEEIATQSRATPARRVEPANAAYVIYTSGSTGRPKGVEIEHRQLVHYIEAITEGLELSAGMKMALVSTFAADLGHTVLFPALGVGGELHVIDREEVLSGSALGAYFERKEIDVVKLTPSHLRALLEEGGRGVVPRRLVALGGEACGWELVEQVQRLRPECRVVNHYGPTENTVGGIMREVGACAEGERSVSVPLGRPLRNVRAYVLDWSGEPAPVGVSGELYLGGEGVGRGYVNEAQWTAERFVPDPFSGVDGGRMYRTGDQVRWSVEGELEFLGRVDQQVKIRGYRIEPGEIEAVLREHAGVRQSVVVAQDTEGGEKQLIGYVAGGEAAGRLSAEQVREYLAGQLPGYMVPGRIVVMDALPLTPNGKLNRRALPAPDGHRPEAEGGYEAPRTAVEGKLAEIWGQLLHRERIGIHDNFFALGGHSLILTRLSSKIAGEFGVKPTLRDLFDATTIVKMTILIANLQLSAMSPDDLFTLIQTLPDAN